MSNVFHELSLDRKYKCGYLTIYTKLEVLTCEAGGVMDPGGLAQGGRSPAEQCYNGRMRMLDVERQPVTPQRTPALSNLLPIFAYLLLFTIFLIDITT